MRSHSNSDLMPVKSGETYGEYRALGGNSGKVNTSPVAFHNIFNHPQPEPHTA